MRERSNVVALCTDKGYFLPCAFLAEQLAAGSAAGGYDVAVVHDGVAESDIERLRERTRGVVKTIAFTGDQSGLPTTRLLSRAAFTRLYLDELLPPTYRRVLYLDSDIYIEKPGLDRLFEVDLGGAAFAAARDESYAILLCPEATHTIAHAMSDPAVLRAYRAALGLGPGDRYLNSGVLLFDRDGWAASGVAAQALAFAAAYPERCAFADQSALNAVVAGRWAELSPKWNYQAVHAGAGLGAVIGPVLRHFAGEHKPWNSDFWGPRYRREYEAWHAAAGWPTPFQTRRTDPPATVATRSPVRPSWFQRLRGIWSGATAERRKARTVEPGDRQALRRAVGAMAADARFVDLDPAEQAALIEAVHAGRVQEPRTGRPPFSVA